MNKKIFFAKDIFKPEQPEKPTRLEEYLLIDSDNCKNPNNKNPKHLVTNVSVYYPKTETEKTEFLSLGLKTSVYSLGKSVILETCLACDKLISITVRD